MKKYRFLKNIIAVISILSIAICVSSCMDLLFIYDSLEVHFIDVGQADSIFIKYNDEAILIDAGNPKDGEAVVDYITNQGISNLKYVVGTHPHNDHIGGMDKVVSNFDIENILMPKATHTTKAFERLMNEIQKKNLNIQSPSVGDTFLLGDATLTVCAPNSSEYEGLNNYSIVLKLELGDTSFLFTGDAEKLSEIEMLDNGLDLSADVLKVGHHGSRTSTSPDFLDYVNPSIAVIPCGKDNDYNHPHKETLNSLNERNIEILRIDLLGTVILTSDGDTIEVKND